MLLEIILTFLAGILAGTFTGLSPGIHINLISAILLSSVFILEKLSPTSLIIFLVAMSITHTFLDFIPSILLGAPEEDSFLSVLPGHQLLKQGQGYQAIILTLYGSLVALLIIAFFIPIFIYLLPPIEEITKPAIPYILIFASLFLILREEEFLISLTVFTLAGLLGILTFNLPVKQPLLPLLTGLFGLSALIISIKNKTKIPPQIITPLKKIKLEKSKILKSIISTSLTAPFASFLPGFGSGQAALISSEITEQDSKQFLFTIGIINTAVMALSFITIFSIQKTRTGTAAAVLEILKSPTTSNLVAVIITIFASGILAFFLGIQISKLSVKYITKVNYSLLSVIIIFILILINIILSNPLGLIVLTTSTSIGIFCILSNSKRINLMGSLLLPTIVFYLT